MHAIELHGWQQGQYPRYLRHLAEMLQMRYGLELTERLYRKLLLEIRCAVQPSEHTVREPNRIVYDVPIEGRYVRVIWQKGSRREPGFIVTALPQGKM
jgi:hypothetical protein